MTDPRIDYYDILLRQIADMNIKFISHKPFLEFEVYDEDKKVIHIKVDTETQAFRIKCKDNMRVFFIADEVVKKSKITTLLNEYSQQLGSLTKSKSDNNSGEIEIEGVQYIYKMNDGFLKEINLFKPNSFKPTLSCKLEIGELSFLNKNYINYILFALAWFTFLTKEQATFVQFA